jgi:hypothetical protein
MFLDRQLTGDYAASAKYEIAKDRESSRQNMARSRVLSSNPDAYAARGSIWRLN